MKDDKKKVTLLLDEKTMKILRKVSFIKTGKTNMSKAVIILAEKWNQEIHGKM